ncbi:DNA primase [Agaribacter marinus]|uniref:DNA primase n=1 Tax=Agaribacter marinus TaxID=1431249 RepID=A0AA37T453_9ALTE|nr:DNA primase [Agaribacter marinus]GLR71185.1 DNA primase [Agaribacter marinus]
MAGRIPQDFIEDIVARCDIVDIIDSRVKLKKAGRNYQACCPFHNEKTPSFSVSQEKQFYYCFGCGAKGNAIGFLMEYDRLEFVEAIEELASTLGLQVPREGSTANATPTRSKSERELDYQVMEDVSRFYEFQLKQHKNRQKVIDYLKGRGLSGEIVKYWGIGYAPDEWDTVLGQFGESTARQSQLLALKLVNENDNKKRYDFFRNRLMFPIRDKRGRVVAFGGRVIDDDGPKYLNSPETRIFHKSNELYGLYQARKENRSLAKLLVVEGYMDVVALSQFGINYAVAALGTATTPEHIQTMFKSTQEVVCCYDGDRAGRDAAWRALENALPYLKDGVIMKFLFLPDGEDPDTMVRQEGKENFEERLNGAMPLSQFFFSTMREKHSLTSIEGKAALKADAMPLINKIIGENQKDMMLAELNKLCGDGHSFTTQLDIKKAKQYAKPKDKTFQKVTVKQSPVRLMMRLLLDTPILATNHPQVKIQAFMNADIPGIQVLGDLHQYCVEHPSANTGSILEAFRQHPNIQHLAKLLATELHEGTDVNKEYVACFKTLLKQYFDARLNALQYMATSPQGLSPEQEKELNFLITKKSAM